MRRVLAGAAAETTYDVEGKARALAVRRRISAEFRMIADYLHP